MMAQRAGIHRVAGAQLVVLQVETGAERLGRAGQHHGGGGRVVVEAVGGLGQFAHRLRRQRVDAVAAIEPHHGHATVRTEALLYRHKFRQAPAPYRF